MQHYTAKAAYADFTFMLQVTEFLKQTKKQTKQKKKEKEIILKIGFAQQKPLKYHFCSERGFKNANY